MKKLTPWPNQEAALDKMLSEPSRAVLLASEMDQGKTLLSVEFCLRLDLQTVLFVGIKDTYDQFRQRAEVQSDGARTIKRIDGSAQGKRNLADLQWGVPGWYFIGQQFFTAQDWKQRYVLDGTGKRVVKSWIEAHTHYADSAEGREAYKEAQAKGIIQGPAYLPNFATESHQINFWADIPLDALIYDEVHQAANKYSNGAKTLHTTKATWRMAMSGTFYGNTFANAWAPTRWLWPELVDSSYWRWEAKWCSKSSPKKRNGQPMTTPRGNAITTITGEKHPGEYVKTLPCYIRHVGKDPVPKPKIIEVELLPEQRRMYDALEEEGLVWLRDRPFVVDLPVTVRSRLRTATLGSFDFERVWSAKKNECVNEIFFPEDSHSTKLDALWPELALYPEDKVVLGTDSKRFAKLATARLQERGLRAVEWSGDVTTKQRDAIKRAWLEGATEEYPEGIQYIVSVLKSFSTGLDWVQQECWRMGVLSESDDQTVNSQWVRRAFRTGPHKHKFSWFKILANDTKDHGVYANLALQELNQARTLASTA